MGIRTDFGRRNLVCLAIAISTVVMLGLDPGIHSVPLLSSATVTEWIAGSSQVKPGNDDKNRCATPGLSSSGQTGVTNSCAVAYPAGFIKYGCTAPDTCGVTSTVSANTIGCTY